MITPCHFSTPFSIIFMSLPQHLLWLLSPIISVLQCLYEYGTILRYYSFVYFLIMSYRPLASIMQSLLVTRLSSWYWQQSLLVTRLFTWYWQKSLVVTWLSSWLAAIAVSCMTVVLVLAAIVTETSPFLPIPSKFIRWHSNARWHSNVRWHSHVRWNSHVC